MDVYDLQEYHIPKKLKLTQKRNFMWTKRSKPLAVFMLTTQELRMD